LFCLTCLSLHAVAAVPAAAAAAAEALLTSHVEHAGIVDEYVQGPLLLLPALHKAPHRHQAGQIQQADL
jgi:hypothetical protein